MIRISAVICTYKRADYLRAALRSLCHQTLSRDQYEVIVIDNAGEREVAQLVEEFKSDHVELRYFVEPRLGLSHARNCGLKLARGRIIAYLDDDARADVDWLEQLTRTFDQTGAAAVGGRVWLDWQGDKPAWVGDEQLSLFTFVDHGDESHVLRDGEYLVGANIAFTVDRLNEVGGFDANLGRQGSALLSGEEAKVLREINERGGTIYYEPAALVWHAVQPARKRPSWLLRRVFWDGASQPLLMAERPTRRALLRALMFDLRQCLRSSAVALGATVRGRKENAWKSLLGICQRAGRVRTHLRMFALSSN
jgi:glycosyltransferase involved in cell wall biosynthesis